MDKYKFFEPLRVRFQDTDLQGHVYFGTFLTYFDEGLTGYMHAVKCTYDDLKKAGVDLFYTRLLYFDVPNVNVIP